ncbi:RNA polymerase subunit sigma-24 [Cryobacterium zongtaii]|uniref:RNA polymerase subunit sigma-24 n=1 Tax=Cryobacterium zongtaii TaxID=1259217 RepID=A0A2S3ZJJ7_9MICO|nr:sigma-70 family RNA polymerase sigma factor [Cryobacterium zongtaii]POH68201.1 RNA polymerase subunit sigma-24 [Cryobacterium zongtaii]
MRRRKDRDQARFVAIAGNVGPDLLRYFQRRVNEDAADLVAETMLTTWRRRRDLPIDAENTRMWIFGIARNVLANFQRGERRRHALADVLRRETLRSHQADSTDALALRQLVDTLPVELAEVVTLAHWEGFSFVEIAALQGVPASTVRGRYRRAREVLYAALERA